MRISRFSWALLLILLVVSPGLVNAEDAVTRKKVQTYLNLASELFQAGDYSGALVELRRAEELSGIAVIRYNIARCLDELDRGADAVDAYEQYLASKDHTRGAASRKKRARLAIDRLEPLVFGGLEVACLVSNTKFSIKGLVEKPVKCPWKNERVPVGSYEVVFEAPGYSPLIVPGKVVAKRITTVHGKMVLANVEQAPALSPPVMPSPQPMQVSRTVENSKTVAGRKVVGMMLTGAGIVGLVGSGYFLYESSQSNKSINSGGFASSQEIEDQVKKGKDYNVYSIIAGAAGCAALVAGIIVLTTGKSVSEDDNQANLQILPDIYLSGVGVSLSGRFP